jgi:type III restriction enzyme
MRLHFDAKQPHQEKVVEALLELFGGLPPASPEDAAAASGSSLIGVVANDLQMVPEVLLANLRAIQERGGIKPSEELHGLDLPVGAGSGASPGAIGDADDEATLGQTQDVPNFSVEMETGTGKTYVYIRTALELAATYGLRKFIIVVPSIAIREGVGKTLEITKDHFLGLYGNRPYSSYAYEGRKLSLVRQFSNSDQVELMVMTLDSFNKEANVIRRPSDKLQGDTPLELIRNTRPVLILDEPQNMESVTSRRALGDLNPLCILRFSATLKNTYNLVHQLTPYEAYVGGLVKQIEVAGIEQSLDGNRPFVELLEVKVGKGLPKAKVKVHKLDTSGAPKVATLTLGRNDDLRTKTGREEYDGYRVTQISAAVTPAVVEFGDVKLRVGEALGADKTPLFDAQIRQSIEVHLDRQQKFIDRVQNDPQLSREADGVKVLSLFFVDKVGSYRTETGDDGLLVELFDKAFVELRDKTDSAGDRIYPWAESLQPEQVRGAYFAVKRAAKTDPDAVGVSGAAALKETRSVASSKEDAAAFSLIMREKERLLSFDEPVAFVFSHSALREGWDNPNVFQICTLNTTVSTDRKRQELGRGLRLCVNQSGVRVQAEEDEDINVLTVVANENYERYVTKYQGEIEEAFGDTKHGQAPRNRAKKHKVKLRAEKLDSAEFKALWTRIRVRTRYSVSIDSDKLVADVLAGLDASTEPPEAPGISLVMARVGVTGLPDDSGEAGESEPTFSVAEVVTDTDTKVKVARLPTATLPNLPQLITDLLAKQSHPVRITRRTVLRIVQAAPHRDVAFANPQGWSAWVAREVVFQLTRQLIDAEGGITYTRRPPDDWYRQERFQDIETWTPKPGESRSIVKAGDASLYDEVICDSNVEKEFVSDDVGKDGRVKLYVKLPGWFKVETPIGEYNPDWALVCDERDNVGNVIETVYLVRETKGTKNLDDLRPSEKDKIVCGGKHFAVAAADLDYAHTAVGDGLKLSPAR